MFVGLKASGFRQMLSTSTPFLSEARGCLGVLMAFQIDNSQDVLAEVLQA